MGVSAEKRQLAPTGHAPTHSPGRPINLGVVASQLGRPENPWGRGCWDEEQADLLPMVPGDDKSEGLGLVRNHWQNFPVEAKDGFWLGQRLDGDTGLHGQVLAYEVVICT